MVEWSALPYLMEKIHYFAKPNRYMAGLQQECSNSIANTLKLMQPCTKIYFDLGQSVILKLKTILPSSWGPFWGSQTCPCSARGCAQCPPPPCTTNRRRHFFPGALFLLLGAAGPVMLPEQYCSRSLDGTQQSLDLRLAPVVGALKLKKQTITLKFKPCWTCWFLLRKSWDANIPIKSSMTLG